MQHFGISIFFLALFAYLISACSFLDGHPGSFKACTPERRVGCLDQDASGRKHPIYEVQHTPGKGLGVIAIEFIPRGTRIITEAPLFTIPLPKINPGQGFRLTDMIPAIESAYFSLPTSEQEELLSLHNFRFESETAENNTLSHNLATILRSNAYNTGPSHTGVFPAIARVNHNCRPNAGNWWSKKTGTRIIYAMQDIEAGEEITVSYIPLLMKRQDRAARLEQYGFVCQCTVCMASEEHDKQRIRIADVMADLKGKIERKSIKKKVMEKRLMKAEKLIHLVSEEGLADYLPGAYHLAAIFGEQAGHIETAEGWAWMKLEELKLAENDSEEVLEVIAFISDLRSP